MCAVSALAPMDICDWYTHCQFHYLWINYPTMHCNHKPYWPTNLEAIRTLMQLGGLAVAVFCRLASAKVTKLDVKINSSLGIVLPKILRNWWREVRGKI